MRRRLFHPGKRRATQAGIDVPQDAGQDHMTLATLLAFLLAQTLAAAIPGPTAMLVISQAMRFGWKKSLFGTAGVCTANVIMVTASAVGLVSLLLANAQLFEIVKWIGVAYLLFVGTMLLKAGFAGSQKAIIAAGTQSIDPRPAALSENGGAARLFSMAFVTQISNPKAMLFFGALLPQFVDVPAGKVGVQFFILGSMVIVIEWAVLWAYGWAASKSASLLPHGKALQYQNRAAGLVLIGAGLWFATIRR
jgi:threonine/homoserine/homoserine lactone efflux protein